MLSIRERNVNHALPVAMLHIREKGVLLESRGMKMIEYPGPVCTEYKCPTERVLFSAARDANPFFHFFESLWILAGRSDVSWISRFNSNIGSYSDNGIWFNGAYGARMRKWWTDGTYIDQLASVIELLRNEPDTRRAAISLWNPVTDLDKPSKDIPCNNMLYFKIRDGGLNMTVCNRSNDAIWGCYGANVVQFSVIQEYIAGMLGIGVGVYRQITDSLHVYPDNVLWDKLKNMPLPSLDPYEDEITRTCPLVSDVDTFEHDLEDFMSNTESNGHYLMPRDNYNNDIFTHVAVPLWNVWSIRKFGGDWRPVLSKALHGPRPNIDWLKAAYEWCSRREELPK